MHGGIEILLAFSCYGNWDKLQPGGPLGSYAKTTKQNLTSRIYYTGGKYWNKSEVASSHTISGIFPPDEISYFGGIGSLSTAVLVIFSSHI